VYTELKRMARHHMRRTDARTIQTTALVNEACHFASWECCRARAFAMIMMCSSCK